MTYYRTAEFGKPVMPPKYARKIIADVFGPDAAVSERVEDALRKTWINIDKLKGYKPPPPPLQPEDVKRRTGLLAVARRQTILDLLITCGPLPTPAISKALNISVRTVHYDCRILTESGEISGVTSCASRAGRRKTTVWTAAQPRSEAPEARKAFPRMASAASMKRPCAGENMGAMR